MKATHDVSKLFGLAASLFTPLSIVSQEIGLV